VNTEDVLLKYVLRLGDNALVLAQRLIELVAHGPELEEELANANFSLDYIGQARMFYSYAGELEGDGRKEDDFAFMRGEREFCSFLLLEQPSGHFGDTIVRSVLFEVFYLLQLDALSSCSDSRLAEIAARAVREIRYHQRHNAHWLVRLGDGTAESQRRVQESVDLLWRYTGELFAADAADDTMRDLYHGPDLGKIKIEWGARIAAILDEAGLQRPVDQWMDDGGRAGRHTEHFGPLIAEMQIMQRSYQGLNW
jgi:ring-1,2-phenylacetyl-CoA epoxidase subunit PaaC